MANKRMFSLEIIDSDEFLRLTKPAQLLYFHLNMRADDDGFVRNPGTIRSLLNIRKTAYDELVTKNWLIEFKNGVVVVTHWNVHNNLRSDRHKPTLYQKELAHLQEKNGIYVNQGVNQNVNQDVNQNVNQNFNQDVNQNVNQNVNQDADSLATQYSIDKDLDIDIDKGSCSCKAMTSNNRYNIMYVPSLNDVREYINNNNYTFNAEYFYNYYNTRNWNIGKVPIRDFEALKSIMDNWQLKENNWQAEKTKRENITKTSNSGLQPPKGVFNNYNQKIYTAEEIDEILKRKGNS